MCFLFIQKLCRNLFFLLPSPPTNRLFLLPDDLPPSQVTDARNRNSWTDSSRMLRQETSTTKPQTSQRPQDQTSHYPHDVQSDQLQRGVVLGPPGYPQGVKSVSEAQKNDRLKKLEKKLEELARMVDMVKTQVAITLSIYCVL